MRVAPTRDATPKGSGQQNQAQQHAHQHQPTTRSSQIRTAKMSSPNEPSRSETHQAFDVAKRNQKSPRENAPEPNPETTRITLMPKEQQRVVPQRKPLYRTHDCGERAQLRVNRLGGFISMCAQRFSLAAVLLTPCKTRLVFTRRGCAPPRRFAALRVSPPIGVRLRRFAPRRTPASRFR